MTVYDISNTCTYIFVCILYQPTLSLWVIQNKFFTWTKKTFEQTFTKEAAFWALIPWIYSGGLTLGVAKNLSKMTAVRGPQKPVILLYFRPFLKKSMFHFIYNCRGPPCVALQPVLKTKIYPTQNLRQMNLCFGWVAPWQIDSYTHTLQVTLSWSFICPHHPLP